MADDASPIVVYQTLGWIDGSNEISLFDTIRHDGKWWLVPRWLEAPTEGWKIPTRIILLDVLRHQDAPPDYPAKFLLNDPIPKSVLGGEIPKQPEGKYVVVERPDIRLDIPLGIH